MFKENESLPDKPFEQGEVNDITDENTVTFTEPKKALMLVMLEKYLGVVAYAAKAAGISRAVHYKWLKADLNYREVAEMINEVAVDYAEARLFKYIQKEDLGAIKFMLRTRGKHRGYNYQQNDRPVINGGLTIVAKDEKIAEMLRHTTLLP